MKKIKSEKGVISLFVLISMLFLLIFIFSLYLNIMNEKKVQEEKNIELKQIYSKNLKQVEEFLYAEDDDIIPIYNADDFNSIGTGEYVEIDNKVYRFGSANYYVLKNNIIVDIKEDLQNSRIDFNDYKLYLSTVFLDKSIYDYYYYYKSENGSYWKAIAYQKFSKKNKDEVKNETYSQNKFLRLNEINYQKESLDFMMIWSDKNGLLSNLEIEHQDSSNINSLNQINIFNKYYNLVDKIKGEYYLFVNVGDNI